MTYKALAILHLATILPAFLIATYLLSRRKGDAQHRMLGRCYMLLMLISATVTLFMPAQVGPALMGHFGFIHLLSLLVFYAIPAALLGIRSNNIAKHKRAMIMLYVGGLLIAGSFALMPGRMLHDYLFA